MPWNISQSEHALISYKHKPYNNILIIIIIIVIIMCLILWLCDWEKYFIVISWEQANLYDIA